MIIGPIRFASTSAKPVDDYIYCINSVRKVDYENFPSTDLLRPASLQRPAMALQALNIELSLIRDQVSNSQIEKMRLELWRETIDSIYGSMNNDLPRKINHPVVRELNLAIKYDQLSKL